MPPISRMFPAHIAVQKMNETPKKVLSINSIDALLLPAMALADWPFLKESFARDEE